MSDRSVPPIVPAPRMPLALIFDCDGVLVDSEPLSCGAWLPVLARRGIAATLFEIEAFIGKSDSAVVEYFEGRYPGLLGGDIIAEREAEYAATASEKLRAFPGIREILIELNSNSVELAVASSARPTKIDFNLKTTGLEELLKIRCSAVEVAHGKPAPDLFLLASSRLNCPANRAIVVEDSLPGIVAARSAGMQVIGFASSHRRSALLEAGATCVIETYSEFWSAIASLQT